MPCDLQGEETPQDASNWVRLASIDPACFACGADNRHGLQMRFDSNGHAVRAQIEMAGRFRGWSNLVHGGILSTVLDETMSWAVITLARRFMLTKSMEVNFKRPVRVGDTVTACAWITEQSDERRALVVGEIRNSDGKLCVSSLGEFALLSKQQFRRLKIMPEEDLELMATLIE